MTNAVIFFATIEARGHSTRKFCGNWTARDRGIGDEQNTSGSNELEFYFTPQFSRRLTRIFLKAFYEYSIKRIAKGEEGGVASSRITRITT